LLTYNGNTYTYSANGELSTVTRPLTPGPSAYQYDALGNLRSVTLSTGTAIGYVIDGENRRVGKTVNGSLVQGFLYENQLEPVAELDGSGNLVSRFVYCGCGAGNIPQYMLKGGVTYRILSDHLGSPRLVIDVTSGAVLERMDYDEFGNVILDTNPGFQPFGFAGGMYDRDTGLVRHGARDYDPETGRWTAKDPIGFNGGDTNLYGYILNDPINAIDLTGEFLTFGQAMTGLSIAGTLWSISQNLDWWRQLSRGELSTGEVATAAGWAVIFFATSKFGSNTRLNKQAADALEKVLKERGMKWSVEIAEDWHDFISGQGIEGWKNLVNAAQEFLASRFGS
jgi:RHS repeat-associated protein